MQPNHGHFPKYREVILGYGEVFSTVYDFIIEDNEEQSKEQINILIPKSVLKSSNHSVISGCILEHLLNIAQNVLYILKNFPCRV